MVGGGEGVMAWRTGPGEKGVKVCLSFMDNDFCFFANLTFNYIYSCHKNMLFGSGGRGLLHYGHWL